MGKVDDLARKHHFFGQIRSLLSRHSGKINRHGQRSQLVLRHLTIKRAINDIAYLLLIELAAVSFLFNQKLKGWLNEAPCRTIAFAAHVRVKSRM